VINYTQSSSFQLDLLKGGLFDNIGKQSGFVTGMSDFSKIKKCLRDDSGAVMMEYIVITTVFLLAVGGLVYYSGSYTNLFPGLLPGGSHSTMTVDDKLDLVPVGEAPGTEINKYGMVGESFAAQTKKAQQLIAIPLP
jgi:hypothetical protein